MFTDYQSLYFAHWLTLAGRSDNQVSRTMAAARVDMNPHQIDAACFALKSPLERGVLLADEVGLGKTIEASLVIAQKWAEHKRKILLVVPASLRKQWNQELFDKFELPSAILDGELIKKQKESGIQNPFDQDDMIVICSYQIASTQKDLVQEVQWNLIVFDEAHKLRNLYRKSGNKIAKNLQQATLHAESKILLSATPIQNNLQELFGLSQMIDKYYFGDLSSFKTLYVRRKNNKKALADLQQRIKPLCHRTLRKQVQLEGGVNFTNRYSLTQDFTPHEDEWQLYEKISEYLQRPLLYSIHSQARHLVVIGMRKTLASSSHAITITLQRMIKRLEDKQLLEDDVLEDLEEADDWRDLFFDVSSDVSKNGSEEPGEVELAQSVDSKGLQIEIAELKEYKTLAEKIIRNAKGEALIKVLSKAFDMTVNLGGQRKAVVFTESRRTQLYIKENLENNGFEGRVILLNGTNTDPGSKAIYKAWLGEHAGSARITGSKTADMKAALVDKFKMADTDILVSTEAGGEGINLQFCSLLINYDLPWNPQKVAQRIGRVHRYGQLNDVVIVNFINRKNHADERVFKILDEKFKLFEGVFGASDEILGAIESNIDIEQRIYKIYQKCRDNEQIQYEFDQLQQELEEVLVVREDQARQALMNNLDRDVVARLKSRRDTSNDFLTGYHQVLLDLAQAELPDAKFKRNHFFCDGQRYDLSWDHSQQNDSEFFRLQSKEHLLAWELVHKAKSRKRDRIPMPSAKLIFSYGALEAKYAALQAYIGESGLLQVNKLKFCYAEICEEYLLVAANTDSGKTITADDAERLLRVPALIEEASASTADISTDANVLIELLETQQQQKASDTQQRLEQYFEQESTKLERWADDRRQALQLTIDELDREIREQRKISRQQPSLQEKLVVKRQIKQKARDRDKAIASYHEAKIAIELEEDRLLDEIEEKLKLEHFSEELFTIRWSLVSAHP